MIGNFTEMDTTMGGIYNITSDATNFSRGIESRSYADVVKLLPTLQSSPAFKEPPRELMEELKRLTKVTNVIIPTVFIIILVLGLIGNALVIYVTIVTNRTAKHPIHSLFVLNLAAADILFLLVGAPYWIVITSSATWRFGPILCPLIAFLSNGSMAASIYTICALAWMRFMALIMPFRFRRSWISTRKAGYFVIVAIWIACTVLALPNLVYYRIHEVPEGKIVTQECRWIGEEVHEVYAMVKLVATYILPLILVSVFYAIIGREVLCFMMHQSASSSQCVNGRNRTEEQKECAKSTMVVLSLILAFLVCWLPHMLQTVFKVSNFNTGYEHAKGRIYLEIIGKCMGYAHACVNPFIYTFASPIFRRSLRSSLREKFCGSGRKTCGINAARIRRRKQHANGNFEIQLNTREATSAGNEGRGLSGQGSATGGQTPKTEQTPMTTALDHHTIHTTVGSPHTSPGNSNGTRYPATRLLLVQESDEAEDLLTCSPEEEVPYDRENVDGSPSASAPPTTESRDEIILYGSNEKLNETRENANKE